MKPALSQVCSLPSPFEQDVEDYAAGQCPAIEIWLGKLETYLQSHSADDVRALLQEHKVQAPVASYQGGLWTSNAEARDEAWALFRRRLPLLRDLGIGTLVVACDVEGPISGGRLSEVQRQLAKAAELAGQHQLQLALEMQARAALGNNLRTAAWLVQQAGSPYLGLCFDAFHYFVGPSQAEDLALVTRDNLLHVQLCDLVGVPRELAADGHRILPGEGDIPLGPLLERLRQIGYDRYVSLELMNPQLWQVPARQFGQIGMTALRQLLGLATDQ